MKSSIRVAGLATTVGVFECVFYYPTDSSTQLFLNEAQSARVLSGSGAVTLQFTEKNSRISFIEKKGDPGSFTDNVKRVLMHQLSWYHFHSATWLFQ